MARGMNHIEKNGARSRKLTGFTADHGWRDVAKIDPTEEMQR